MKVHRLPEALIRGIAAGEVVERPSSALKELIENAVDAGARTVFVEWREAGRQKILVRDDGVGMTPDDVRLALERHATSKIDTLEDLERVGTFGFRGEALPSISAVSRFEVATRTADAETSWMIRVEDGGVVFEGPGGHPSGTTVTASDLFYNVPARLKFLKSDGTERSLLLRTVEDAALASPAVAFRVLAEKREVINEPSRSADDLINRLVAFWGQDRVDTLTPIEESHRFLRVWGWVSDVNSPQPTSRYQRLFVNRRAVVSRRLSHALYDGYRNRLMVGRHPAAVLYLEIDPTLVDVNVHPAKREVRLSHEEEIHQFLSRAVQNALTRGVQPVPVYSFPSVPTGKGTPSPDFYKNERPSPAETQAAFSVQSPFLVQEESPVLEGLSLESFRQATFEPLVQLYQTYVLCRWEGRFFLFDQHAAAERVLYERLSEEAAKATPARQNLLIPWVWETSPEMATVVENQKKDFEKLGYELEPFGGHAVRVKAVPAVLSDGNYTQGLLEGLVDDLVTGRIPKGWETFLIRVACRGSVKAGDPLSLAEMDHLIKTVQACPRPWTCPHGRPVFLSLSDDELARRFKRV